MKSITRLALEAITTALFATGSAFAYDSELRTIDNHHGVITYLAHRGPVTHLARPEQTQQVTIAFGGHAKGVQRETQKVDRGEVGFREISTPHGAVSYFAPVK